MIKNCTFYKHSDSGEIAQKLSTKHIVHVNKENKRMNATLYHEFYSQNTLDVAISPCLTRAFTSEFIQRRLT